MSLKAAADPLGSASSTSGLYGTLVAGPAEDAAQAAGVGPLADVLRELGARTRGQSSRLSIALSEAGATLDKAADAYARSDHPLGVVR